MQTGSSKASPKMYADMIEPGKPNQAAFLADTLKRKEPAMWREVKANWLTDNLKFRPDGALDAKAFREQINKHGDEINDIMFGSPAEKRRMFGMASELQSVANWKEARPETIKTIIRNFAGTALNRNQVQPLSTLYKLFSPNVKAADAVGKALKDMSKESATTAEKNMYLKASTNWSIMLAGSKKVRTSARLERYVAIADRFRPFVTKLMLDHNFDHIDSYRHKISKAGIRPIQDVFDQITIKRTLENQQEEEAQAPEQGAPAPGLEEDPGLPAGDSALAGPGAGLLQQ